VRRIPVAELLEGLTAKELLESISANERMAGMSAKERLKGLPLEEIRRKLQDMESDPSSPAKGE